MNQQSSPDESTPTDQSRNTPARRRSRFPLVPILLPAIFFLAAGCVQLTETTADMKYIALLVATMASAVTIGVWFFLTPRFSWNVRWRTSLVVWGLVALFHYTFEFVNDGDTRLVSIRWRHAERPDELLPELSASPVEEARIDPTGLEVTEGDYPRFLGTGYWPEVSGTSLESDWRQNPPEELWRREIGAGWSSFAIVGDHAITQEQRGESELVVCYDVKTGDVVWVHSDPVRFGPNDYRGSLGGGGPRATPTIHDGRVITMGATGIVNCLNALTGDVIWSHDAVAEQGAYPLLWGMSGSPLVLDDMVVVNVGAPLDEAARENYVSSLVAYDLTTGDIRWTAGNRITAYASPVLATLAGEQQILQINQDFVTAHRASDGEVLWEHPWPGSSTGDANCSQPVPLPGDRVFLSKGYSGGASLIEVKRDENGNLNAQPVWNPPTRRAMRTKLANVVIRDGYVYGLDDGLLECLELAGGEIQWKKRRQRRIGHGQILLVGDVILIISESGELVLVECNPEEYRELASLQALDEAEITWNNPAFAAPYLLVRNAREAVCYRLPLAE